jgi:hypothetical protein
MVLRILHGHKENKPNNNGVTAWEPIIAFQCLFLLHHICEAYRTMNYRLRGGEKELMGQKIDFDKFKYAKKLNGIPIQDNLDAEGFETEIIPFIREVVLIENFGV